MLYYFLAKDNEELSKTKQKPGIDCFKITKQDIKLLRWSKLWINAGSGLW